MTEFLQKLTQNIRNHKGIALAIGVGVVVVFVWLLGNGLLGKNQPSNADAPSPALDYEATDVVQRSFKTGDYVDMVINNIGGNIIINTDSPSTADIRATKRSRGPDQQAAANGLSGIGVTIDQSGDKISVNSQIAGKAGSRADGSALVDLKITTPPNTKVTIKMDDGSISVTGPQQGLEITGQSLNVNVNNVRTFLTIQAQKGAINAIDVNGPCDLEVPEGRITGLRVQGQTLKAVASGNVSFKDTGVEGAATIRSGNGGFHAERFQAGTLDAQATNGRGELIESTVTGKALVRMDKGSVVADKFNAGLLQVDGGDTAIDLHNEGGGVLLKNRTGKISLTASVVTAVDITSVSGSIMLNTRLPDGGKGTIRTQTGNITMLIEREMSFQLDASTKKGKLTDEFPATRQATVTDKTWRGELNQGGMLLTLATDGGDIVLSVGEAL